FYRGEFKVEFPSGFGQLMTLWDVASELSRRLTRIFPQDPGGRRPVHGEGGRFQTDPRWKDLLLFYEYFHGDTGAGIGASHQTGWTGVVAKLLQQSGEEGGSRLRPRDAPHGGSLRGGRTPGAIRRLGRTLPDVRAERLELPSRVP